MRKKPEGKDASRDSEFVQMPLKGTPIRYEQKQPVRNRQQGATKFMPRSIGLICDQENILATQHLE
jgi:hypothetical protein